MSALRATNGDAVHETAQADALRDALVDKVKTWRAELDAVLSAEVEAALRAVPRHLFLPGVPMEGRTRTTPLS